MSQLVTLPSNMESPHLGMTIGLMRLSAMSASAPHEALRRSPTSCPLARVLRTAAAIAVLLGM
jgi:hypothetical protein